MAWFYKLSTALLELGFSSLSYDISLFIAHINGHTIIILIYVDDIIITTGDTVSITTCISQLQARFAIKNLGALNYFLSIEVVSTLLVLHLSQHKYITDLLALLIYYWPNLVLYLL
jgi:Reverse transcriptase (RNA-dependent DNA polymerase)